MSLHEVWDWSKEEPSLDLEQGRGGLTELGGRDEIASWVKGRTSLT
jgi:hypothetical protein